MMRGKTLALAMASLLSLGAGCSFLEPQQDQTRYFVLTPVVEGSEHVDVGDARLSIGPVSLPTYLDRPEILVSPTPHRLEVRAYDRWAEPLPNAFPRILKQDLVMLLGADTVVDFASVVSAHSSPDYVLEVDVLRFEEAGHGKAALSARWTIKDAKTRSVVLSRETNIERPLASTDTAAGVQALSECIADLSREIAKAIASLVARRG